VLSPHQPGQRPARGNGPPVAPGDLTLDIGGIRVRLSFAGQRFSRWLEGIAAYRNFITATAGPTDAAVRLRFRGQRGRGIWNDRSEVTTLRHRGDECRILHHDFLARSTPGFRELEAILPREDVYAFDNLPRFLVSVHAPARSGFLLHAATLIHQDAAFVLYGLSGAGKSTAAALSTPRRRCLAEDATLVRVESGRATAWATPLLHHPAEPPRPGGFPVRGFFRLAKTPAFCLKRLSGADGVRSLMQRVLLYEGFHLGGDIFGVCSEAATGTAQYELGLARGENFWPALLEALDQEA